MSFIKLLDEIRKMLNITIALADSCCEEIEIRRCLTRERRFEMPEKLMENNAKQPNIVLTETTLEQFLIFYIFIRLFVSFFL